MAGERIKLEVQARESVGSGDARRLRSQGLIPGVLYGSGKDAQSFCVGERDLRRAITGEHGMHAILDVVVAGDGDKARHAVLKEYQLHPTKNRLLHVDLHEVRLDRPIQASVVVELVGESEGAKVGGVLSQTQREVTVEALPMSIPDHLEIDISALQIGDSLRVSDLSAPEGVTVLDDPEAVLVTVYQPRVEEEPETVPADEVEGEEGAEPAEGDEAEAGETGESDGDAAGDQGTVEG
jgi:large subunit ribosomal protein L25